MALESEFAREVNFRALEPSVISHLMNINSNNPDISSEERNNALTAILGEYYPSGYCDWFYERLSMIMS